MLNLVYMAFAGLGCLYVLVAAFLGHATDFGGHDAGAAAGHGGGLLHLGGGGAHGHAAAAGGGAQGETAYGIGGGGHGSVQASAPAAASFHFPFFSPLALATLVAAIGGWGLIAKFALGAGDGASLAVALPAALATAYAIAWVGWRLVSGSRASSVIVLDELTGTPAEVTVPIPAGGVGEAMTMASGQPYAAPAREEHGAPVPRGARVIVVEAAGTTLAVRAASSWPGAAPPGAPGSPGTGAAAAGAPSPLAQTGDRHHG